MKTHFKRIAPSTVQEAVGILLSWMSETEKLEAIMEDSAGWLHHGFMRHVRNEWQLWDTSTPLVRNTKETYGVEHADDVSGLIQGGLLAAIKEEPFDYDAEAAVYRAHWARQELADQGKTHGLTIAYDPVAGHDKVLGGTLRTRSDIPNILARPGVAEAPRKRGILHRIFGAGR